MPTVAFVIVEIKQATQAAWEEAEPWMETPDRKGEGRSAPHVPVLLVRASRGAKLKPQSTLTATRHGDDTDTAPLSAGALAFLFAMQAIVCHKMAASTKSTVQPMSWLFFVIFLCINRSNNR